MTIFEKLQKIQVELKAPKNLYNTFGKYYYRSAESVLEALKPLEDKYKVCLILKDEIVNIADRFYIKATAILFDTESTGSLEGVAFAREDLNKKGMDGAQVTGSTSSYARKYALNGLFLLDDTKDSDTNENRKEVEARQEAKAMEASELSKEEIAQIEEIVKNRGFTVQQFCEQNNIQSLAQVKRSQYEWILKKWGTARNG